jgi:tetratricopeptide (TPR) repeat protein
LQELRRYEDAVASYDKAIALKPDFAEACGSRGNSLRDLKRYEEAVASYNKAIELKPEFSLASENLGYMYLLLGKHAEGLRLIAKHSGFIRFAAASGVSLVLGDDNAKNRISLQ